jgi:hypothetical protein
MKVRQFHRFTSHDFTQRLPPLRPGPRSDTESRPPQPHDPHAARPTATSQRPNLRLPILTLPLPPRPRSPPPEQKERAHNEALVPDLARLSVSRLHHRRPPATQPGAKP